MNKTETKLNQENQDKKQKVQITQSNINKNKY
jgi:hypothetical protein